MKQQIHVVLKGFRTVVAMPDGQVFINATGNPGMATGGMGDILTGMIAGILAQENLGTFTERVLFAVHLHGLAGDLAAEEIGEESLVATDLLVLHRRGVGADTRVISTSEAETFRVGRELAESMSLPRTSFYTEILGQGRPRFARGLAAGFGLEDTDEVSSPTFTLINEYRGRVKIYHIDLYRIETGRLEGLGLDEIFDDPNAAVIIEWAERLG